MAQAFHLLKLENILLRVNLGCFLEQAQTQFSRKRINKEAVENLLAPTEAGGAWCFGEGSGQIAQQVGLRSEGTDPFCPAIIHKMESQLVKEKVSSVK